MQGIREQGSREKAGTYLHNGLKGSRVDQAHKIRPNVLAITMTTGYNTSYTGVPGEIKRRELDPQVSPEEIMSREVELGCESWTSFASVFPQQQRNGHCPCDSAQHGSLNSNCAVH